MYEPSYSDEIGEEPGDEEVRLLLPHPVQGGSICNQQNKDFEDFEGVMKI